MAEAASEKRDKLYIKRMAVFFALEQKSLTLLKVSLEKLGERLEKALCLPNNQGLTPLLYSLKLGFYKGFAEICGQLPAESKAFLDVDLDGSSYASYLARKGNFDVLETHFKPQHRALLLKQNKYGKTPLLEACEHAPLKGSRLLKTVEFLLAEGSFVHHSDFSNCTPLRALLSRRKNASNHPDLSQTLIVLARYGALLCQRLPKHEQFLALKAERELLTYGAFFGKQSSTVVLPESICTIEAFEVYLNRLKTEITHTKNRKKLGLKNQLTNISYALRVLSLPASSKDFGQTFFKPSFRPVMPDLSELPNTILPKTPQSDPNLEKARQLHAMSLFWLLQCYKEYSEPHPVAIFIKRNTIWTLLVCAVVITGTLIAMMIDNAVRRFNIPGYRDNTELSPAVQDAVNEANGKTIPYFIAIGALLVFAFLVWTPYLVVTQSEKRRQRELVRSYPNLSDMENLLRALQPLIYDFARIERQFNQIDNIEKVESFTNTTADILSRASEPLEICLQ